MVLLSIKKALYIYRVDGIVNSLILFNMTWVIPDHQEENPIFVTYIHILSHDTLHGTNFQIFFKNSFFKIEFFFKRNSHIPYNCHRNYFIMLHNHLN